MMEPLRDETVLFSCNVPISLIEAPLLKLYLQGDREKFDISEPKVKRGRIYILETIFSRLIVMIFKTQCFADWFNKIVTPFRFRFIRGVTYNAFASVFVRH